MPPHDLPERLPRQSLAARCGKEHGATGEPRPTPRRERAPILLDVPQRDLPEGNEPSLLSLAERRDDAAPKVHVADPERYELTHSQAGGVREAQHRAIAQPAKRGHGGGLGELYHLPRSGRAREPSAGPRPP